MQIITFIKVKDIKDFSGRSVSEFAMQPVRCTETKKSGQFFLVLNKSPANGLRKEALLFFLRALGSS